MKIIVALCVLFAVISAEWVPKTYKELVQFEAECIKSENVSEANVEKIKNKILENEPEVRCYLRCMSTKIGPWDDVKGFDIERGQKQLESCGHTITKEQLADCFTPNTNNVDPCTWSYEGHKCLYDKKYITKSFMPKP